MSASGIAPDSIPRGAMHCAANKGNCFDYIHVVIFPYSSRVHFPPPPLGEEEGGGRDYRANRTLLIVSNNRDAPRV